MSLNLTARSVDTITQEYAKERGLFVSIAKKKGHLARNCPNKKNNEDKRKQ